MSIEINGKNGEFVNVKINDEILDSDDGEVWYCPKSCLKDLRIDELPMELRLTICKAKEDDCIVLDTLPIEVQRISDSKVHVIFEDVETRKYWNAPIGLKRYMERKKTLIEERSNEIKDVKIDSYDDDGAYISMYFSADIESDLLIHVVEQAEQLIEEIDGATLIALDVEPINLAADNESDFSLHVVLPILRKLGFTNVKYNHGKREYGKDFVFARLSEFDDLEHWGAQIKFGDVNGGIKSQIEELISQADSAFKMPFYNIYTRRKERISKFAIIISGKYTENAIERVCEGIENNALKNNIVFIDGDKIEILKNKFFTPKIKK